MRACLMLLLCALVAAALPPAGLAQVSPDQALAVAGKLESAWNSLTPRLTDWRYHAADGVDGANPATSVAGWEQVKPGHAMPAPAGWYRTTITVPAKVGGFPLAAGGDLVINLRADDTGETYVGGRLVQRFEKDLGIMKIAPSVKPGDTLQVAVLVRNYEGGGGLQSASLTFGAMRPLYRQMGALLASLQLCYQVGTKNNRLDWLGPVVAAVGAVDLAAMERGDTAAFTASLTKAGAALAPIGQEMKKATIYAVGQSHIDYAWEWPWRETVDVCRRTFGTALDLMADYPELIYAQSQAAMYQWIEQREPALFAHIQQAVKAGRWEIVGGMWIEPDSNLPSGESFVRQLLYGKRYFMDKFGVDVTVGWTPDSFGYNWNLPQIYRKAGVNSFVTVKLNWNDTTKFPHQVFWWEGPDGSRLLTFCPRIDSEDIMVALPYQMLQGIEKETGVPVAVFPYGVGDHGGGVTREMLEMVKMLQEMPAYPKVEAAPVSTFIDKMLQSKTLPVWKDELYFEYHRGVQTTWPTVKQLNRRAEQGLHDAELFSTWATLHGAPCPTADLAKAWQLTLANQMHDILPGSGFATVFDDAVAQLTEVGHITGDVTREALDELASTIDTTGEGVPVVVFNPLSWPRSGVVELDLAGRLEAGSAATITGPDGKPAAAQWVTGPDGRPRLLAPARDVPACGYALYRVTAGGQPATGLTATTAGLENALVKVEIDPATGWVSRIQDKANSREVLAAGQQLKLQAFQDNPKNYDAWNLDADYVDHPLEFAPGVELAVAEQGPVRATVRAVRKLGKSTVTTDYTLTAGSPRLDMRTTVDWQEEHVLLKAALPASIDPGAATYEIPYASISRTTKPQTPAEKAKFEVPGQQWADLSTPEWGVSLLNDSKYGYDAKDNVLRLSLLRSPATRQRPPVVLDKGVQHFTWSVLPHAGDWRSAGTVRAARELNDPLLTFVTWPRPPAGPPLAPPTGSLLAAGPDNIVVESVKLAEGSTDWIIRWYETAGKATTAQLTLPLAPAKVVETDLLERPTKTLAAAKQVTLATGPFEIKTIRVSWPSPAIK